MTFSPLNFFWLEKNSENFFQIFDFFFRFLIFFQIFFSRPDRSENSKNSWQHRNLKMIGTNRFLYLCGVCSDSAGFNANLNYSFMRSFYLQAAPSHLVCITLSSFPKNRPRLAVKCPGIGKATTKGHFWGHFDQRAKSDLFLVEFFWLEKNSENFFQLFDFFSDFFVFPRKKRKTKVESEIGLKKIKKNNHKLGAAEKKTKKNKKK